MQYLIIASFRIFATLGETMIVYISKIPVALILFHQVTYPYPLAHKKSAPKLPGTLFVVFQFLLRQENSVYQMNNPIVTNDINSSYIRTVSAITIPGNCGSTICAVG